MKKIVVILISLLISVVSYSQVTVATGGAVKTPEFFRIGGTTADTLYASDTLAWSIRVQGLDVQKILARLSITKVTGTVSDTVYFYGSFDGTTKDAAIDSIFNSNVSTGYKYITASRWTNFSYPYLLIWNHDKGGVRTAVKSVRRLDVISRNE
jgi:hypothetical protein